MHMPLTSLPTSCPPTHQETNVTPCAQQLLNRQGGRRSLHGDPAWEVVFTLEVPEEVGFSAWDEMPEPIMKHVKMLEDDGGGFYNAGAPSPPPRQLQLLLSESYNIRTHMRESP